MVQRRSRPLGLLLLGALATAAAACSAIGGPELAYDGPEDGTLLSAEDVASTSFVAEVVEGDPGELLDTLTFTVDGEPVDAEVERADAALTLPAAALEDGERRVAVVEHDQSDAESGDAGDDETERDALHQWEVRVDATPPEVELDRPEGAAVRGEELTLTGTTEAGAEVVAGDAAATADDDGAFELTIPELSADEVAVQATDEAGNTSDDDLQLVTVPSRVEVDEFRTVHVSFCAWNSDSLKQPILEHIESGRINAVQLDLKDETGTIGFDSGLELAERSGAADPPCDVDLEAAVEELHALDVAVIGRIVAFADPVLAPWAWDNGHRDWVIQTAGGDMYTGGYDGFTSFAADEIVDYNIGVAEAAAAKGVDHIVWDYVRKPDGPAEQFTFPGLEGRPQDAVADFVATADERLAPYGVQHGASLYGVSADRPTEVAQDVEQLAEHLDYVSPMIYPSHWGPGEYGVADPLMQPGDMVAETLQVWLEATEGKRARVAPWLEDSNWPLQLGYPDRAQYVREQIAATYDAGIREWLLWDSAVRYTEAAMIQPDAEG